MIIVLSWRNIWRNKKRTFLLMTSIVLGLLALLMAMAFMNGLSKSFVENAINTQYSHIQIHHPEFELEEDPGFVVSDADSLVIFLNVNKKIKSYTLRTKIEGLVSSQKSSKGIKIIGVNPKVEGNVTGLDRYVSEGEYFTNIKRHPIVIGRKIAEQLNLKIKSKVLLTYFNSEKELTAEAFRVSGILQTNSPVINGGYVFIKQEDFYAMYGKNNIVHEIAIRLYNIDEADVVSSEIKLLTNKNSVETWKETAPELESSINENRLQKTAVLVVIILAFSFGLINTMLMQISERMREIGMLIINGMERFQVSLMIIIESVFAVTLASIVGVATGFLVISYFSYHGMDFSELAAGFESQGWSKIVYPVLYTEDYSKVFICSVASGFIGAAIPAYKAMRLNVISAIRR